jgi:hypothetical protein
MKIEITSTLFVAPRSAPLSCSTPPAIQPVVEPEPNDDDGPPLPPAPGAVNETTLVIERLLCGNSPFGMKDSRQVPNGMLDSPTPSSSLREDSPPSPIDEAAVVCADDKSQSKHVSLESPVDSPADDLLHESRAAPVTIASVISFLRLSLLNQMLGEGLIQ